MSNGVVAGIDEVGRGCLAGPVVAAMVILDPANPVEGLADSKTLAARHRREIAQKIRSQASFYALGRAEASEIDQLNILQATLLAMKRAASMFTGKQQLWVQVDGIHYPDIPFQGETVAKGDRLIAEISAASILAKVYRDSEMSFLNQICSGYGFSRNKGYPTKEHLAALEQRGPTRFHRQTFGPVRRVAAQFAASVP